MTRVVSDSNGHLRSICRSWAYWGLQAIWIPSATQFEHCSSNKSLKGKWTMWYVPNQCWRLLLPGSRDMMIYCILWDDINLSSHRMCYDIYTEVALLPLLCCQCWKINKQCCVMIIFVLQAFFITVINFYDILGISGKTDIHISLYKHLANYISRKWTTLYCSSIVINTHVTLLWYKISKMIDLRKDLSHSLTCYCSYITIYEGA